MAKKSGNTTLAAIYAQALHEAAHEAGVLAQVSTEVLTLGEIVAKSPEVEAFLISPTIAFENKRAVIDAAFSAFSQVTRHFLLVLVDRSRAVNLGAIVSEFIRFSQHREGVAEVQVQSARPLQGDESSRISALMAGKLKKKILLREKVRPELLGGMVVIHDGKMWDSSIANGLKQMAERMESLKLTTIKWTE
jgi:ATP synthase F1 delta subunit